MQKLGSWVTISIFERHKKTTVQVANEASEYAKVHGNNIFSRPTLRQFGVDNDLQRNKALCKFSQYASVPVETQKALLSAAASSPSRVCDEKK